MRSSTLQFVVAGALIAAWAWMLGRPILTNLFRRSRRDSVGHFRYQQAVLSQPMGQQSASRSWYGRRRPLADWRAQPVEQRRLQSMLGFALATFVSLLLAIALRGVFVRLFALMAVSFVAYLAVAVYIGSSQLRRLERGEIATRRASAARRVEVESAEAQVLPAASILEGEHSPLFDTPEVEDFEDHEFFGQGIFDEGFYEPIPELAFKPLNLDASLLTPDDEQPIAHVDFEALRPSVTLEGDDDISDKPPGQLFMDEHPPEILEEYPTLYPDGYEAEVLAESPEAIGDEFFERPDADEHDEDYSWVGHPIMEFESPLVGANYEAPTEWEDDDVEFETTPAAETEIDVGLESESEANVGIDVEAESEVDLDLEESAAASSPMADPEPEPEPMPEPALESDVDGAVTFTAPPQQRTRPPKRNKARPIYIESQLDEDDEPIKAVND